MTPTKKHTVQMGGRLLPFALTKRGLFEAEQEFQIQIISGDGEFWESFADPEKPGAVIRLAALVFAGTRGAKPKPSADWIIEHLDSLDGSSIPEAVTDFFQMLAPVSQQPTASQNQAATTGLTSGASPEFISDSPTVNTGG